jgi:hypothetical protein
MAVLALWIVSSILVAIALLGPALLGNCGGDTVCLRSSKHYFWDVIAPAFVLIWIVLIALIRSWKR